MTSAIQGSSQAVSPSDLNLYHKNPRVGNVEAIKESLQASGQYKPIVVNKGSQTGRENEVLAGNHTLKAIRDLAEEFPSDERWHSVDVWEIDVDDDRAARIVVADNRTSDLGQTDDEILMELLQGMDNLDGTGYVDEDLDDLIALLQESDDYDEGGSSSSSSEAPASKKRDDGLIEADDLEERSNNYSEGSTRMVILNLSIERFVWVQAKLEEFREKEGVASNTEVMIALLEEWSDEVAPDDADPVDAELDELEGDPEDEIAGDGDLDPVAAALAAEDEEDL